MNFGLKIKHMALDLGNDIHQLVENVFGNQDDSKKLHSHCKKCNDMLEMDAFESYISSISFFLSPKNKLCQIHGEVLLDNKIFIPEMWIDTYISLINHHYGSKDNHIHPDKINCAQYDAYKVSVPSKFILQNNQHFVVVDAKVVSDKKDEVNIEFNVYDPFYTDLMGYRKG